MKLSVSLSAADVALLDRYAAEAGLASRSAALQHAVRLLRQTELEHDYATAFAEWESSGDRALWEGAVADGLDDPAR